MLKTEEKYLFSTLFQCGKVLNRSQGDTVMRLDADHALGYIVEGEVKEVLQKDMQADDYPKAVVLATYGRDDVIGTEGVLDPDWCGLDSDSTVVALTSCRVFVVAADIVRRWYAQTTDVERIKIQQILSKSMLRRSSALTRALHSLTFLRSEDRALDALVQLALARGECKDGFAAVKVTQIELGAMAHCNRCSLERVHKVLHEKHGIRKVGKHYYLPIELLQGKK